MLILNSISKHSVNMDSRGKEIWLASRARPSSAPQLPSHPWSLIVWLYGLVPLGLMFHF